MPHYPDEIEYSDKYFDDFYEYRHVLLPKNTFKKIQKGKYVPYNVINRKVAFGDGVEVLRSAAIKRMGSLRVSSSRASHSTVQETEGHRPKHWVATTRI
jgi:hypothetical protein